MSPIIGGYTHDRNLPSDFEYLAGLDFNWPTRKSEFNLVVFKTGFGSGVVTSSPPGVVCGTDCLQTYKRGTDVVLSAVPEDGSEFKGWRGEECEGTGSCQMDMNANRRVTAMFGLISPPPVPVPVPVPEPELVLPSGPVPMPPSREKITITLLVEFDFDESFIRAVHQKELDTVADLMKRFPKIVAEIEGHTDSVGTDEYNIVLSRERANSVTKALVKRGVNRLRLTPVGYGESGPIATNGNSKGRQRNRRVLGVFTGLTP